MSNCAVCHKPVKSGVVVHSECLTHWISVKKRPPEYDAPVWGWDAQCHCAKEVNYLNGEFFDVFGEDADITHWMPLPAPPEVGT